MTTDAEAKAPVRLELETLILTVRGQRVILDADLARLYGVETRSLNQAVTRNPARFPGDFAFQLTSEEVTNLRSQIVISSRHGGRRYRPFVFTEHGALMAANSLNSAEAVEMSLFVVRAFVKMRDQLTATRVLEAKLAQIEKKLLTHDVALQELFRQIRPLLLPEPPKRKEVGFHVKESQAKYSTRPRAKK